MNHTAHSPRSSGSTEQDTLVPACRHRRHLRRSADPRPAIMTGATRRWDGEHRDAPRVRNSRHHITTSSPRRAPRNVTRLNEGEGEERMGEGMGDNSSHHSLNFFFRVVPSVITTSSARGTPAPSLDRHLSPRGDVHRRNVCRAPPTVK